MPAGGSHLAEHSVARPGFAVHTDVAADAVHAGAQVGVSLDADAVDVSLAQAGNADRIRESGHARRLARAEHTGQRVRIPGDSPQEVRPPDCLVRRRQGYTLAMSYRGKRGPSMPVLAAALLWSTAAAAQTPATAPGASGFPWPEGARAAVSLTFDDARPSQVDAMA